MATVQDQVRPGASLKPEAFVEAQLARARRRIRLFDTATALLGLAVLTLIYGLGMVLLDRSLDLSPLTRQLAFGGYVLLALGYLGFALIRPLCRKVNPYYAALRVEETLPEAKNSVVNWLDLHGRPLPPAIRNAVSSRAAKDLSHADLDRAISGRRVFWLGAFTFGLFLGTVIAIGVLRPGTFFSLLSRAFAPFTGEGIAKQTHLELIEPHGGNAIVPVSQPVNFRVRITGKVPAANKPDAAKLKFRYSQDEPEYQERPLESDGAPGEWSVRLPGFEVKNGFWYKLTAGDNETPEYRVEVRSLPLITRFEVACHYRPYLLRKDRRDTSPSLQDLRGTEVTLIARTNRNVKDGQVRFESEEPLKPITGEAVKGHPDALQFRFVLDKECLYRIRFTASDGESSGDSVAYPVRVIPDLAPQVELTKPGEDVTLPADGTLALEGQATDDFGLTGMTLRLRIKDGAVLQPKVYRGDEKKADKPLFRFDDGSYPRKLDYKDFVELAKLKDERGNAVALKPGTVIEYWLEATDNCDYPQANVGRTEKTYLVTIAEPKNDKKKQDQDRQQLQKDQEQHNKKQDEQLKEEDKQRKEEQKKAAEEQKTELDKQADKIKQELQKEEEKGNAKPPELQPENKGEEKGPGKENEPNKEPQAGEPKPQPKEAQPDGKEGEPKPDPKDGQKPQPNDKGQPKPDQGEKGDPNKQNGDSKPQPRPGEKAPGEEKAPGNKQDNQQAGKEKGQPNGQPSEKPGEPKQQGNPQKPADQGNAKGDDQKPGAAKPDGQPDQPGAPKPDDKGKPTPQTAKGTEKKEGTGTPEDKAPKGDKKPDDKAGAKECANCKGDGPGNPGQKTANGNKPDKDGNNPNAAGNQPAPQQDATPKDAAQKANDLNKGDAQQRKDAAKALQDMAQNAKDPKVRQAAKEALEKAGEKVASGEPGTGDKKDVKAPDNVAGVKGNPAGPDDKPAGTGKGSVTGDPKTQGEPKPPDPNAGTSKLPPQGEPKPGEPKEGVGEPKEGNGNGPKKNTPNQGAAPGSNPNGSGNGNRTDPNTPPSDPDDVEAMVNDLNDKLRAGDLLLRKFEEAAKDKDMLKKLDMTKEEAEKFIRDYRQQQKDLADKLKELEKVAKPNTGGTGPYGTAPRTIKGSGPNRDPLQNVGPLQPPSEFEKSTRDFSQDLSRMKPKKDKQ